MDKSQLSIAQKQCENGTAVAVMSWVLCISLTPLRKRMKEALPKIQSALLVDTTTAALYPMSCSSVPISVESIRLTREALLVPIGS